MKFLLSKLFMLILISSSLLGKEREEIPKLTVKGQATLYKPADQMKLNLGVVTQGKDVETALGMNNEKMIALVENLDKIHLTKEEYQTSHFEVTPIYSHPPKNPPADWQPIIIGYEIKNRINIKTSQLTLAPKIIEIATQSGVNSIDRMSFDLKDPQKHRAEAIMAATENAIADAISLAKTADLDLVRVLDISLDNAEVGFRHVANEVFMAKALVSSANSTPLESGEVEVRASVGLVFEIASRKQQ